MNGTRDDDLDWLRALGGRAPEGADAATRAEAALLREAHRRWPAALPLERPTEADFIALMQRGRAEAGGAAVLAPAPLPWWRRWLTPGPLAGAALVAVLAVVVVPWSPPETERGGVPKLVVQAAPEAARDALAAELQGAGLDVRRYQRGGRFGLDAELPRPTPPAVAAVLARRGLQVPADGALMVEYAAPGAHP